MKLRSDQVVMERRSATKTCISSLEQTTARSTVVGLWPA